MSETEAVFFRLLHRSLVRVMRSEQTSIRVRFLRLEENKEVNESGRSFDMMIGKILMTKKYRTESDTRNNGISLSLAILQMFVPLTPVIVHQMAGVAYITSGEGKEEVVKEGSCSGTCGEDYTSGRMGFVTARKPM